MPTRWDVERAVRSSALPAPSRLVMLTLATLADNATAVVPLERTPSLTELAGMTGLGRSTVVEHCNSLEASGWLKRTRPAKARAIKDKERTRYALAVPAGPVAGLVDVTDLSTSPGVGLASPGAGLELVQELDQVSPGAGHSSTPLSPQPPSACAREAQGGPFETIAAGLHALRPDWTREAIRVELEKAHQGGHAAEVVAEAARRCYSDPGTSYPTRLHVAGTWWHQAAEAVRATAAAAVPQCPSHQGQPAHNCGPCRHNLAVPSGATLPGDQARAIIRAATARGRSLART